MKVWQKSRDLKKKSMQLEEKGLYLTVFSKNWKVICSRSMRNLRNIYLRVFRLKRKRR